MCRIFAFHIFCFNLVHIKSLWLTVNFNTLSQFRRSLLLFEAVLYVVVDAGAEHQIRYVKDKQQNPSSRRHSSADTIPLPLLPSTLVIPNAKFSAIFVISLRKSAQKFGKHEIKHFCNWGKQSFGAGRKQKIQ